MVHRSIFFENDVMETKEGGNIRRRVFVVSISRTVILKIGEPKSGCVMAIG